MNELMFPALAYICTPRDVERLKAANPTNRFFAATPQQEDDILRCISNDVLLDKRILSLISSLTVYAGIHGTQDSIRRLRRLIAKIGVSLRFVRHVDRHLSPYYQTLLTSCNNDPLVLVVNPPEEMRRHVDFLVTEALADGSYRARRQIDGLSPSGLLKILLHFYAV